MKKICTAMAGIIAVIGLTGCNAVNSKYTNIPLVPALSEKEVVDYYKNSMKYDTIVSRNLKPQQISYETKDVQKSMGNKLQSAQQQIEKELYNNTAFSNNISSIQQHAYIKSVVDDKTLIKDSVIKISEALDFYFVDVKYNISPKVPGLFKADAKYLGIHGAFVMNANGASSLDKSFINTANNTVAEYIKKTGEKPQLAVETRQEVAVNTQIINDTTVSMGRKPVIDVDLYNKAIGGSLTQTAHMPNLYDVYTPSGETGTLSGYGIYPQGIAGLSKFGYNRNSMKGNIVLRYVFKTDILNKSQIAFVTVYPVNMEIENKAEYKEAIAPQFVEEEIKKTIEQSDRAINNNDIAALMSGKIYDDIGIAVLNGFYSNNTYLMRKLSNLNRVIGRKDNYYLTEVESVIQEGPKGTQSYGTYKDTYLMVIKQVDTRFIIDDYVCIKREMVIEPQIELDSSIIKRLAALGLRGEVSEENKVAIQELLNGLYKASTDRTLKGMYDSFESDTSLLISSRKEYLNEQIRQWLTNQGVDTKAVYKGTVTEWIGGAGKQVELMTEELIDYEGKGIGQYMQIYYLVSSINDKWAIEEMKVLEIKDVKDSELEQIRQRVAQ